MRPRVLKARLTKFITLNLYIIYRTINNGKASRDECRTFT